MTLKRLNWSTPYPIRNYIPELSHNQWQGTAEKLRDSKILRDRKIHNKISSVVGHLASRDNNILQIIVTSWFRTIDYDSY